MYLKPVEQEDAHNDKLFDMLQEIGPQENGFQNPANGLPRTAFASYIAELVDKRNPQYLQPNRVPSHTYWFYTDQHEPAGFVKIRFELDDFLRREGGHIGYGMSHKHRHKGYGKKLLQLALQECHKHGVNEVLLICDKTNISSIRVIEANEGVLEKEEEGNLHYWVKLA
jgi:predicted acetyltransferase